MEQLIIDQDILEIPDRDYTAEALIPSSALKELCKELKGLGSELQITIENEIISFDIYGDLIKVNLKISPQVRKIL